MVMGWSTRLEVPYQGKVRVFDAPIASMLLGWELAALDKLRNPLPLDAQLVGGLLGGDGVSCKHPAGCLRANNQKA